MEAKRAADRFGKELVLVKACVAALVASMGWPAMYGTRDYVEAGGLMRYGANYADYVIE